MLITILFERKSKEKLVRKIKFAFKFKAFFEGVISRLAVKYYDGKHPKHLLWTGHYKFILDNIKENIGGKIDTGFIKII